MKGIYKFYWDCGRMNFLDGVFIESAEDVKNTIGKDIYFGEVLGKHSDISGTLEKDDIQLISDDPEDVEWFKKLDLTTGYNPVQQLKGI